MKFKKGDRVKVIETHSPWYKKYIGKTATIVEVDEDRNYPYNLNLESELGFKLSPWCVEELQKVTRGRPRKKKECKHTWKPFPSDSVKTYTMRTPSLEVKYVYHWYCSKCNKTKTTMTEWAGGID